MARDIEAQREAKRRWGRSEAGKAYKKRWAEENAEKLKELKKLERQKNIERYKAYRKQYYIKNCERLKESERQRRLKDIEGHRAKVRAQRAANPERFREIQRAHKEANPAAWRLYGTRKSAKAKGIECDLDLEWFQSRLDAGVCELSGLPFDNGKRTPNSPSVDRIDPKGPYTKANCRMILWWLNRALTDLGQDYAFYVFRAIFDKMETESIEH